ncbi:hypothetical protein R6Q59_002122 [Mikania micrantha]
MMAGGIWMIRSMNEDIDLDEFYYKFSLLLLHYTIFTNYLKRYCFSIMCFAANDPTKFSLKVCHGGEFTEYPGRSYEHEKINIIDNADIEDFGMDVLEEMVKTIGYPCDMVFYFYFKIPYMSLDLGLKPLVEDVDFERIFEYVRSGVKMIQIYVEHENTHVHNEEDDPNLCDSGDSEEDDPDFCVNKHNLLLNVEVDMEEFRSVVDDDVEEMDDEDQVSVGHDTNLDIEDFESHSEDDDHCTDLKKRLKRIRRHAKSIGKDSSNFPFYPGQLIEDKKKINEIIRSYALECRRQVYVVKNDSIRFRIVCLGTTPTLNTASQAQGQNWNSEKVVGGSSAFGNGQKSIPIKVKNKVSNRNTKPSCPFAIQISRRTTDDFWCVKTIQPNHKCLQTRDVGLYTMSYIADEIEPIIKSNPDIPIQSIQDQLQKKHDVRETIYLLNGFFTQILVLKMVFTKN